MSDKDIPLFDHIQELRGRLFRAVMVWLGVTLLATLFVENYLLPWLLRPLRDIEGVSLVLLSPTEGMVTYFRLALVAGFGVALPYILYEVYGFIAPALFEAERAIFLRGIPAALVLFVAGAIFTVEVLLPPGMIVLSSIFAQKVASQYSLDYYLSFFSTLVLWMGVIFQTPLVMYVIARLGGVTPQTFSKGRRIVWFLAAVAAAVITPTLDPFMMLLVTAPFILLYEIGLLLARLAARQRARRTD